MTTELVVVISIILIAILIYLFTYFLKKKHYSSIDDLNDRKNQSQEAIPMDKARKLEKMMITGQSKELADSALNDIEELEVVVLPSVESLLFEAEQATDRYRFKNATRTQNEADEKLNSIKEDTARLNQSIEELLQREEANLKKIDTIKKRYHKVRKELLAKSFTFGDAINNLEDKLGEMESQFTSFSDLTASGDHEEAKKIVNRLENRLTEMETLMKRIPKINKTIKEEYLNQLEEIESGYKTLVKQQFVFPEDVSIETEIKEQYSRIEKIKHLLAELKMDEIVVQQEKIRIGIEELYDAMEIEIESKEIVTKLSNQLTKIIYYISKQDKEFSLELDRISQSYVLYKEEEETYEKLHDVLIEQKEIIDQIKDKLDNETIAYSEARDLLETSFNQLEEVSQTYESLSENMYSYREEELTIKEDIEEMEQALREMKRYVENKNLPGLPDSYLDLFFYTTDHLESLSKELAKAKLNLEEVSELHEMCEDDIDHLAEETDQIVDNALLTELTSQRLYRYREDNQGVLETIKYSETLFLDDYDYETALKMVREKLESIEPGAFEEVKERYMQEKNS